MGFTIFGDTSLSPVTRRFSLPRLEMTYDERRALNSPFSHTCLYVCARVTRDYIEPRNCNDSRREERYERIRLSRARRCFESNSRLFIDKGFPSSPPLPPSPYHDGEIRSFVSFATVPNPAACHSKDDNGARGFSQREREPGSREMIGL